MRSSDSWLKYSALAMAFVCFWALLIHRHLYADGGAFFTHLLSEPGFFLPRWGRTTAYVWTQWPAVLAIQFGARDPQFLSWLYGAGLFSSFPMGLWACHRLANRESRPLLALPYLSAFTLFALMASFPISESLVAAAVFWPVWIWVMHPRALTRGQSIVLGALLVLGLAAYESFLFLGPLWVGAAAWQWRKGKPPREVRSALAAVIVAGAAACAVASVPSVFMPDPLKGHFFASLAHIRGWRTLWFTLIAFLSAGGLLLLPPRHKKARAVLASLAILFAAFVAIFPLVERTAEPGNNYLARVFAVLLPLGLGALGLTFRERIRRGIEGSVWPTAAIAALGLAAAFHQGVYARSWQAYTAQVRTALTARSGAIPFEQSLIHPSRPEMAKLWQWNWEWTVSLASLWIGRIHGGPGQPHSVIACSGAERNAAVFCPLGPAHPEDYEKLAPYGVTRPF